MKVLFLQMVLAFAKLQYYIPGKSLNKNFRRLFVSLPQFLGYFNDPAINNNIVINGFIDHNVDCNAVYSKDSLHFLLLLEIGKGPYLAFLMAISLKFQGCCLQAFPLFAQHFS